MQTGLSAGATDRLHLLRAGRGVGLIGSLFVLALYFALILWGLRIALQSKDRYGAILSFGVVSMLFWHVFINIGMVLALCLWWNSSSFAQLWRVFLYLLPGRIGLLLNVSMRRYLFDCGIRSGECGPWDLIPHSPLRTPRSEGDIIIGSGGSS